MRKGTKVIDPETGIQYSYDFPGEESPFVHSGERFTLNGVEWIEAGA